MKFSKNQSKRIGVCADGACAITVYPGGVLHKLKMLPICKIY